MSKYTQPKIGRKEDTSSFLANHINVSHQKLKFRQPKKAGDDLNERRDLKRELEIAEEEHQRKKGKGIEFDVKNDSDDNYKRRALIAQIAANNSSDEEEEEQERSEERINGKGKEREENKDDGNVAQEIDINNAPSDTESNDEEEEEEEDETLALMRELENIKRERQEEKQRLAEQNLLEEEEKAHLENPLLHLENVLGKSKMKFDDSNSIKSNNNLFNVKRRWDDDAIFKNQSISISNSDNNKDFINDLTRSEFHKRFMKRYIR